MAALTSEEVKDEARRLGADLVGICSAAALNANPPDPKWPQTAERLWPECRSVIAIAKRLPWGMFRARDRLVKQSVPLQVLNMVTEIAVELSYYIEDQGFDAFAVPVQDTDTDLKRGTYGPLSLRHVAIEAGLGTLGLNMLLITPEYGPRVYVAAVMTNAELTPDSRLEQRLCLGVSCSRCLMACPADAVEHWGLNKRRCSSYAQQHGMSSLFTYMDKIFDAETIAEKRQLVRSLEVVDFWLALRTGIGAYGGCPRCLEACPVGADYALHLKEQHAKISEVTEAKRKRQQEMLVAEQKGEAIAGIEASKRWIGVEPVKTRKGG